MMEYRSKLKENFSKKKKRERETGKERGEVRRNKGGREERKGQRRKGGKGQKKFRENSNLLP